MFVLYYVKIEDHKLCPKTYAKYSRPGSRTVETLISGTHLTVRFPLNKLLLHYL
jgi:hypothetical protein